MADGTISPGAEPALPSYDLKDGAYMTNNVKIPAIDVEESHSFLVKAKTLDKDSEEVTEELTDPFSRQPFVPGDKVLTLSTFDNGRSLSLTISPESLAFTHRDIIFTPVEEGQVKASQET